MPDKNWYKACLDITLQIPAMPFFHKMSRSAPAQESDAKCHFKKTTFCRTCGNPQNRATQRDGSVNRHHFLRTHSSYPTRRSSFCITQRNTCVPTQHTNAEACSMLTSPTIICQPFSNFGAHPGKGRGILLAWKFLLIEKKSISLFRKHVSEA